MSKIETLGDFWKEYEIDQTNSLDKKNAGSVYAAKTSRAEDYAVKISEVHPNFDNGLFLERYMIAQTMEHQNLLEYKEGLRFEGDLMTNIAIMPLVELGSLDQNWDRCREHKASIAEQVIDGLYYLHSRGIVWQNLSAKHMLLEEEYGNYIVKFINYGNKMRIPLAFFADYEYLAPEQLSSVEEVNEQTDIWALGVFLYQLWTGRLPFGEKSASFPNAKIKQRITGDWTPGLLDQIPNPYQGIVKKCLEKNPAERWQNCGQIIVVIKDWYAAGNAIASIHTEETTESSRKILRKPNQPIVWWKVAVAILLAAILGYWVNTL